MYQKFFLALLLSCFSFLTPLAAYQFNLCILAIFRDEGNYLKEWIDYHRFIGVQHFVLYNHLSNDDYISVLKPYIEEGVVELYDWNDPQFPKAQFDVYREGIKKMKNRTKWLAVIDIDEFIVMHNETDLVKFLKSYENCAGLVINWQFFGTSNIQSLRKEEWITKNLIYKFPTYFDDPQWNSNHYVKSIIRPDRINPDYRYAKALTRPVPVAPKKKNDETGLHVFMPVQGYFLVDSNMQIQLPYPYCPTILVDKIQLNHYFFRTIDWFYEVKIGRRYVLGDSKYTSEKIHQLFELGNSELDLSIQSTLNRMTNKR